METVTQTMSRGERTRSAILAAGESLFLEFGYDGTSMDKIAEVAGITKQTVYSHVANKETLFLDVIDRMTGGAGDELAEVVNDPTLDTPADRFLREFAEQQMLIVLTPRLMQLRRLVIGETWRFPALGALFHDRGPNRSIRRLSLALAQYARAGVLVIESPDRAASHFNWLVMGGPTNDAMLLGDKAIPDHKSQKRHAGECVRIFLAAYRAE